MEMRVYLSILIEWLLAASAAALFLWVPLLAVAGSSRPFFARARDVLAWSSFIIALLLIVFGVQKWWPLPDIGMVWLAIHVCISGMMGVLLITRKIRKVWGTLLFLVLLLGMVWSEHAVFYILGYFRDYLPSSWAVPVGRYWKIIALLAVLLLGIACAIASFGGKDRRKLPS